MPGDASLKVAIGLGFVIFVHELGHFAVAKLCGVKCEKFYLGFDIGGLKLCKFHWGETEYGIGILPLGGYVKMLGQEDNPTQRSGRERAGQNRRTRAETLDPRSYKAQSVPRRMAIISAGVVMNLIFACVFAAIAYGIGFRGTCPASSRQLLPGEPAWRADIQPGDQIWQSTVKPATTASRLRFRDLTDAVILGNLKEGVELQDQARRRGRAVLGRRPTGRTSADRLSPTIGVDRPALEPILAEPPASQGTPTADLDKFQAGRQDRGRRRGADRRHYRRSSSSWPIIRDDTSRSASSGNRNRPRARSSDGPAKTETVEIDVPATPMQTLGLVDEDGADHGGSRKFARGRSRSGSRRS